LMVSLFYQFFYSNL